MQRKTCILHANCQGTPLARLLMYSPQFRGEYNLIHFVNHTKEDVPPDTLASASLLLFQELGEKWGVLCSREVVRLLPKTATALRIPNMMCHAYWPFWTSKSSMNFGDELLDDWVDKGLSLAEIAHLYAQPRIVLASGVEARVAKSFEIEHGKEQAHKNGTMLPQVIETASFVEANYKEQPLFTTINHPGTALLVMTANAILQALAMPALPHPLPLAPQTLSCDPLFYQPIAPAVAKILGIHFVYESTTYPVYGKQLTFKQYLACYVDCRQQGLPFLPYLQQIQM